MKNEMDEIGVALATSLEQPPRVTLPPRMIWLRGVALERQRATQRMMRITRILSAAGLLVVAFGGVLLASSTQIEMTIDTAVGVACSMAILGFTALPMIRSAR